MRFRSPGQIRRQIAALEAQMKDQSRIRAEIASAKVELEEATLERDKLRPTFMGYVGRARQFRLVVLNYTESMIVCKHFGWDTTKHVFYLRREGDRYVDGSVWVPIESVEKAMREADGR